MTKNYFNPETGKYYDPKKDHKVAIVTGGNQGIGFYTVLHLYLHGYTVYMLARSEDKALKAIKDIEEEGKKRADKYDEEQSKSRHFGEIQYIHSDLTDLKLVEQASKLIKDKEQVIDILINNAGIMAVPFEMTKDNYEIQYQVNVVAPILLTFNLLPLLNKASDPRVVFVSSIGHMVATKYETTTDKLNKCPAVWYNFLRYGISKLAMIHFAKMLGKNHSNILSIAVHPGIIHTSLYTPFLNMVPILSKPLKAILEASTAMVSIGPEEGSLASLKVALDPELTTEKDGDKFFKDGGVPMTSSKLSRNEQYMKQTWDWNIDQLKQRGFTFDT